MEDPSRLNQGLTTSWPAPRCCAHRLPEPPNLRKHVLLRLSDFFFRCRISNKAPSWLIVTSSMTLKRFAFDATDFSSSMFACLALSSWRVTQFATLLKDNPGRLLLSVKSCGR